MIPKIIHLCWLSGDPFPADIVRCLESWNEKLKDYTIWLWGKCPKDISVVRDLRLEVREFDLDSTIWTRQAYEAKKYAFAADYIRLYALYNYGGIYLDADVLIYKPFDELLSLPYFIGCDQIRAFEAAVIGCKPKCNFIRDVFETYKDKCFIKKDGSYDMLPLPIRFRLVLVNCGYRFIKTNSISQFKSSDDTISVFVKDFFNSRDALEVHKTSRSFCAHNYLGSWTKKSVTIKDKIKKFVPNCVLKCIYTIGQNTWAKSKFSWYQIPFEK